MTERYDIRDERGRITAYVLRETPYQASYFRPGARAPQPDSPLAVAACLTFGIVMLAATLEYLWVAATAVRAAFSTSSSATWSDGRSEWR